MERSETLNYLAITSSPTVSVNSLNISNTYIPLSESFHASSTAHRYHQIHVVSYEMVLLLTAYHSACR